MRRHTSILSRTVLWAIRLLFLADTLLLPMSASHVEPKDANRRADCGAEDGIGRMLTCFDLETNKHLKPGGDAPFVCRRWRQWSPEVFLDCTACTDRKSTRLNSSHLG